MKEENIAINLKVAKTSQFVEEINSDLFSHRNAAKKYGVHGKILRSRIPQLSLLNFKPLEIGQNIMIEFKEDIKAGLIMRYLFTLKELP